MGLMQGAKANILDAIGETPIVKLNKVAEDCGADIYVKCEFMNPGGSVKDRIGVHMINVAEREGKLKPGGTIIEATSGNTGMGLALVAATRGYKCIFIMADKQSEEKRTALRSVGAEVVICPTSVEPEDPRSYYSVAERLAKETPNAFYTRQYWNPANPETHYLTTGPEIWEQTGGDLDALVVSIGTGGTVSGLSRYLKEKKPELAIVGVDPVGSIYYDYFHTGKPGAAHAYYVEGIGEDFMPDTMDLKAMDDCMQVSDRESFQMARRLIREEGLLVGGSCGSAVVGAIKYAQRLETTGERKKILVLLPDASNRYLSKFLNDEWLRDAGLLDKDPVPGTVKDLLAHKELRGEKTNDLISAKASDALGSVVDRMKTHGISQVPVLGDDGEFAGVVTEVQVLDALVAGRVTMKSPVGEMASTATACTVRSDTSLTSLTQHLAEGKSAVVLEGNKVVGLLTKIDLIEHLSGAKR